MSKILIYGASGHAKVICSCIESNNHKIIGLFDDNINIIELDNYQCLGLYDKSKYSDLNILIGIGNNKIRFDLTNKIFHSYGTVVHNLAIIDRITTVGVGSVIFHNAVVQRGSHIGKHCIINTNASIDHDCVIDDFVHICPGVILCGGVKIGQGSFIGAGSIVLPGVTIGAWVTVAAGTVVRNDVPDNSLMAGNPGRIKRYNYVK